MTDPVKDAIAGFMATGVMPDPLPELGKKRARKKEPWRPCDDPEAKARWDAQWSKRYETQRRSFKPSSGRSKDRKINPRSTASLVVLDLERSINCGKQITEVDE